MSSSLDEISKYDPEKALEKVSQLVKPAEYSPEQKNTKVILFHKGTIFRGKIHQLNQQLNQSLSQIAASAMIKQHARDVSHDLDEKLKSKRDIQSLKVHRQILGELGMIEKQDDKQMFKLYLEDFKNS